MPIGRDRGFTLAELLIGLTLVGLVATVIGGVLTYHQRLYRLQTQRAALDEEMATAVEVMVAELRGLDATAGDILDMSATTISYRATRGMGRLCRAPSTVPFRLTLSRRTLTGERGPSGSLDSAFLLLPASARGGAASVWVRADVQRVSEEIACPLQDSSVTLTLAVHSGPGGASQSELLALNPGSPVNYFELARLGLYRDADGEYWLGIQTFAKATGAWGATQGVVGPLTPSGVRLSYLDANGQPTSDRTRVARIGILIRGRTSERVRDGTGALARIADSLSTWVALRNNCRVVDCS